MKKLFSPQGTSGITRHKLLYEGLSDFSGLHIYFNVLHVYLVLADTGIDHQALLKQFEHLNHQNPDTFEPKDLDMLIKAVSARFGLLWGLEV